ncbi:hypothetical protein [Maricaulis sp. CAU 1757]
MKEQTLEKKRPTAEKQKGAESIKGKHEQAKKPGAKPQPKK